MKRIFLFAFLFELFFSLTASSQLPGFTITGNPKTANGASWTYFQSEKGVTYDLRGILFKPVGEGKFPAVIINHGTGGNVSSYSKNIAKKMVEWGYVCIATNYTHSGGVPCGSAGICELSDYGLINNNVLRGMKCWDILASLSYTDTNRIATFGHRRGAFLTTSLVANNPNKFKAASHTAGGIIPGQSLIVSTISTAEKIKIPYLMHHGEADNTVPLLYDQRLDSVLSANQVIHQLYIYPGYSHADISLDALMLERTKKFFDQYVVNPVINIDHEQDVKQGQGIHFIGHSVVYYLGSTDVPISSTKYENANISGVVCRFKWANIEPSPGVFNWAFVDAEIQKARNSRKKSHCSRSEFHFE